MAKLNESDFRKEISSGKFRNIYVIYGDEKYLVRKYTDDLVKKVTDKKGMEFDYFRFNSESSLEMIADAVWQLPIMTEYKCVCIIDYDVNSLSSADFSQLEDLCSDPVTTTVLIFSMPTWTAGSSKKDGGGKNTNWSKLLSAADKGGAVIELKKLGDIALEKQLSVWCEQRGCKLSRINASKIISRVGTDLTALKNETEKLCAYADGKEITNEMILSLCVMNTEARIYSLSDYIARGDYNSAYRQLHLLFGQKEPPEIILSVLSSAFIDMYRMRAASEAGKSISETASDFKYGRREFVLKNAASNMSKYSTETLRAILEAILETDIKMKSSRADSEILLETLISRMLLLVKKEGNI